MVVGKVGRNNPCPCGSGDKYKHCCARKRQQMSRLSLFAVGGVILAVAVVLVYSFTAERGGGTRQVWDPAHGHYHTVP